MNSNDKYVWTSDGIRMLLVEDDEVLRHILKAVLTFNGFIVRTAEGVTSALSLIRSEPFDVLLTDLHMPRAGDGLTVLSVMRHLSPGTVCFILSANTDVANSAKAFRLQVNKIFVKPMATDLLVKAIMDDLKDVLRPDPPIERMADILAGATESAIAEWLTMVDSNKKVLSVDLSNEDRCAYLPQLFHDLVFRLNHPLALGSRALIAPGAVAHGILRRKQGYSAAMMVEESRMLQVSIFKTLQENLNRINFDVVLVDVMQIADEVDSQLAQAMTAYVSESNKDSAMI